MKKSENNNLKDKFVCEFYSTLIMGIIELDRLSSSSSSLSSQSSLSSSSLSSLSSSSKSSLSSLSSQSSLSSSSQSSLSSSSLSSLSSSSQSSLSSSSLSSLSSSSKSSLSSLSSQSSLSSSSQSSLSSSSLSSLSSSSKSSLSSQSSLSSSSISSLSSLSSNLCPNDISELTTTVRDDIEFTYDRKLALEVNDSANKDNYIMLYSGDTTEQSYDDVNKFYGDDTNVEEVTANGYCQITINDNLYYIPVYSGANTTDCCSNLLSEIYPSSRVYEFVGYALIKVNGALLVYTPVYTEIINSSSSSYSSKSSVSSSSISSSSESSLSSSSLSSLSSSSQSSLSSNLCPNDISELTASIRDDIEFTYDKNLALEVNDSANKDNYIKLYTGDTGGQTYDDVNKFYGDDTNTDELTSNGFVSITINSSTYYIQLYSGTNTTDCCSNLEGIEESSGTFTSAGLVLIKVNGDLLRWVRIYTKE